MPFAPYRVPLQWQEELAFVLALYGPSRDRDLLKYFSSALAGTAAVVLCLFGGILPYAMLVGIPPFTFGRSYGTAVSMTYFELMIAIGEARFQMARFFCCLRVIGRVPQPLQPASVESTHATCPRDTRTNAQMLSGVRYVFSASGTRRSFPLTIASNRQRSTPDRRLAFIRPVEYTCAPPAPCALLVLWFVSRPRL